MGWTAATISIAVAINIALFGLMGPFAAALMQSIGVRKTVLLGLGIVAISTALTSFVQTPLELVLTWGIGVGAGVGMIGIVLAATVSTRWFVKRRGTVTGILTAANATGQLVFLPVLAVIAQNFGWRNVGLFVAAACTCDGDPDRVLHAQSAGRRRTRRPFGATCRRQSWRFAASAQRQSAPHRIRDAARTPRESAISGCSLDIFYLRSQHERIYRDAFHSGVRRSRHRRGACGRISRDDGRVRSGRHDALGYSYRPV